MTNPINKNRNRLLPTFANINLLGVCNANCYFCLGKDIETELFGLNHLNIHFLKWKNFLTFVNFCKASDINKLYITGQTADGLQYEYLDELVDFLQNNLKFSVGVRTNGILALEKMSTINKMTAGIGYSIHTINKDTNYHIMGSYVMPNWDKIIPLSGKNVRISIVLGRYNINEFFDLVKYISGFSNVKYIQVRRISTETRLDLLREDIELYEQFYNEFKITYPEYDQFYLASRHKLYGKEIDFWRTVETNINSFNYFTDGTISDQYFIVEGYLKYRNNDILLDNLG